MQINFYNCTDDKRKIKKALTFVSAKTCNIYGTCSVDTPAFIMNSKPEGNYVSWDSKMYFVTGTTYSGGKWIVHCAIDDLMTNQGELLNMSVLVSRSEEQSKNIVDNNITLRKNDYIKTDSFGTEIIGYSTKNYVIGVI